MEEINADDRARAEYLLHQVDSPWSRVTCPNRAFKYCFHVTGIGEVFIPGDLVIDPLIKAVKDPKARLRMILIELIRRKA